VIRAAGDVIDIDSAASSLGLSRTDTAKRLARWTKQGWLRRVAPGAYVPASLDSLASEHVLDDPWVLVPALYAPAYIGGRTALEHWSLTEQIFKDIVVVTGQPVRTRTQHRHGADFTLKHIQKEKIFGTKSVWRHHSKVAVSDIHRTIVDVLDDAALGGGMQHVADCLHTYLARPARDDALLIQYADRLGNGAVFKRLGFLLEGEPTAEQLLGKCLERLTQGNAKLDPALKSERLITKWRILIPRTWARGIERD
jgi:predicted transcriptional regulator of viral defense system